MSVQHFIRTVWSKKIQDDLEEKCKLVMDCTSEYEGDCKYAQTVKILAVGEPTIGNYIGKDINIAYSNIDTYNKMMEYGISFEEYSRGGEDLARLISKDPSVYEKISDDLYNIDAKDGSLHSVSGQKKQRVGEHIASLNVDDGIKMILYKQQYPSYTENDRAIVEYLNSRQDVSPSQMKNILLGLGALVTRDGKIKWKW